MINDVEQLLEGDYKKVVRKLTAGRDDAAAELRFERAAAIQKRIERIQDVFVILDVHRKRAQEILSTGVKVQKRLI